MCCPSSFWLCFNPDMQKEPWSRARCSVLCPVLSMNKCIKKRYVLQIFFCVDGLYVNKNYHKGVPRGNCLCYDVWLLAYLRVMRAR